MLGKQYSTCGVGIVINYADKQNSSLMSPAAVFESGGRKNDHINDMI